MGRRSGTGIVIRLDELQVKIQCARHYSDMLIRKDIAILLCWLGFCSPCRCDDLLIEKPYPSLNMQGSIYPSACIFDEKTSLRNYLRSLKYPDEEKAWKIVEMILCAPNNKANRSYLESHVANRLKNEKFAGERIGKIFALTKAWDATLLPDVSDRKSIEISLLYFSNEACVKNIRLKYNKNKWMLNKISEVCD